MDELCDSCKGALIQLVRVTVDGKLFKVCSFDCKDAIIGSRKQDAGCGIIEGDKVRDVNMCSECALLTMPFTCYMVKRDHGRTLMFVGYGRRKDDE